jgi:hypothetical protein
MALLLLLLLPLVAGCGPSRPTPGPAPEKPPVSLPPSGSQDQTSSSPSNGPTSSAVAIPGNQAALQAALSAPSTFGYRIEVVTDEVDPTAYLEKRLREQGPGPDELLLLLFADRNWDVRFAVGPFTQAKRLTPDQIYSLVKAHFLPKARGGDPAQGLADLFQALNQAVQ